MSVQIPLTGSSQLADAVRGVTIPIGTILPLPQFGASREERVARAVAAAAALQDASEALKLARQAVDDPAVVAGNVIDRSKLDPVLAQVSVVLDRGAGGQQAAAEQSAAARAVGADAALVVVAQAGLAADTTNEATAEARQWVALIEPVLLERAARAGLRRRNIDFVPKTTGTVPTSRVDDIEGRLKALEERQKDDIEGRLKALEERQKDDIEGRLKALEEGQKTASTSTPKS